MPVADIRIRLFNQVAKVNSSDNLDRTAIQHLTIISAHSTELRTYSISPNNTHGALESLAKMTPPAKITVPLRLDVPERNRTSQAAHIIESVLKLQEDEDLSPVTKSLGDEVRGLALDSLKEADGNIGREDFAVSWRIFEHLVKSKKDAAEAKKDAAEAKKEAAAAEATLSVDKARLQRLELLLSEGDWAGSIVGWVRSYEKPQAVVDREKYVMPKLRARGVHGDPRIANDKVKWRVSTLDVRIGLQMIKDEELKIKQWREDGSDETKTPLTPALDRLNDLCISTSIQRQDYINVMKIYAARNEEAHKKPPLMENFVVKKGDDYSID